jgi:hypothetical protein
MTELGLDAEGLTPKLINLKNFNFCFFPLDEKTTELLLTH